MAPEPYTHSDHNLYSDLVEPAFAFRMPDGTYTAVCPETRQVLGTGLSAEEADQVLTDHTPAADQGGDQ